jgi:N-acetylglucosamine-6-phosphate deacetylase
LQAIVATATSQPASLLGLSSKGVVRKGFDADLVLLDRHLNVEKTWVEGRLVCDAHAPAEAIGVAGTDTGFKVSE